MKWIFAPVHGVDERPQQGQAARWWPSLFTVPLAIAALASLPDGPATGIAIVATFILACVLRRRLIPAPKQHGREIHRVATCLSEHDLRRGCPTRTLARRIAAGAGRWARSSRAERRPREPASQRLLRARAADELATGNVNLSQRTEEQASTLEETAAAMEELSATVKQNAENCRAASKVAGSGDGRCAQGRADRAPWRSPPWTASRAARARSSTSSA